MMESQPTTRRLAAIVIADVVGYTRLMEHDDTRTFAALGAIRSEVIDPPIVSVHPDHVQLADLHWYAGLRKAGIPDQ